MVGLKLSLSAGGSVMACQQAPVDKDGNVRWSQGLLP
jgi:hypothetical protein